MGEPEFAADRPWSLRNCIRTLKVKLVREKSSEKKTWNHVENQPGTKSDRHKVPEFHPKSKKTKPGPQSVLCCAPRSPMIVPRSGKMPEWGAPGLPNDRYLFPRMPSITVLKHWAVVRGRRQRAQPIDGPRFATKAASVTFSVSGSSTTSETALQHCDSLFPICLRSTTVRQASRQASTPPARPPTPPAQPTSRPERL